jgi:pyruvate-formate lyase-activating enzyme
LNLSVAVVRSSAPHPHSPEDEIFICQGCQAREHKRAQRKKDSRSAAGAAAAAAAEERDEDEERRKVVVFNCGEFVEFTGGETVLPTRITCYCRHHKEKKGFQ